MPKNIFDSLGIYNKINDKDKDECISNHAVLPRGHENTRILLQMKVGQNPPCWQIAMTRQGF